MTDCKDKLFIISLSLYLADTYNKCCKLMGNMSCECLQNHDAFISNCLSLSDNPQISKLDQSNYSIVRNQGTASDYRILLTDLKKNVMFKPAQFYYEGQAKVSKNLLNSKSEQYTAYAHGKGIMRWPTNSQNKQRNFISYVGQFQNNMRQGIGRYSQLIGTKSYEFDGKWKGNIPQYGIIYIDHKQVAEIESLMFGEPSKDQDLVGYVNNKNNFRQGTIKIISKKNGDEYNGEFKWNPIFQQYQFHGWGKLKIKNKNQEYNGQWKQGKFHGQGTYTWGYNYKFTGNYHHGIKEGRGKLYYEKNKMIEGQWKANKKQGKFIIKKVQESQQTQLMPINFSNDILQ